MSYLTDRREHQADKPTCPLLDEWDNNHLHGICEDCDVVPLARKNLGDVEYLYQRGGLLQEDFEAYMYLWALLSPASSRPEWRRTPADPVTRRVARKLLHVKGLLVPADLVDDAPAVA